MEQDAKGGGRDGYNQCLKSIWIGAWLGNEQKHLGQLQENGIGIN